MLGSVFGAAPADRGSARRDLVVPAWLVLLAVMVATMAFCGAINVDGRAHRVPAAAPRAEAGAVDHRDRHVASSCRTSGCSGTARGQVGSGACRRVAPLRDRLRPHPLDLDHRVRRHGAAAALLSYVVAQHPPGEGDARHGPGLRRGPADGHRREPHHRLHVALGGVMAGAAGVMYAQFTTTRAGTRASSSA